MTIQHKTITGTDLHEPKGVAAAAANKVYVANGSASGAWSILTTSTMALPKGKFYFYNIGSPYTLSHSASTAKVAPTTIASGLGSLVTEATSARLTYTGTLTAVIKLDFDVSVKQAAGSCFYNAATDDYFEIYAQNTGASGDMIFQKVGLTLTAT
jgi:hypothetical protein